MPVIEAIRHDHGPLDIRLLWSCRCGHPLGQHANGHNACADCQSCEAYVPRRGDDAVGRHLVELGCFEREPNLDASNATALAQALRVARLPLGVWVIQARETFYGSHRLLAGLHIDPYVTPSGWWQAGDAAQVVERHVSDSGVRRLPLGGTQPQLPVRAVAVCGPARAFAGTAPGEGHRSRRLLAMDTDERTYQVDWCGCCGAGSASIATAAERGWAATEQDPQLDHDAALVESLLRLLSRHAPVAA